MAHLHADSYIIESGTVTATLAGPGALPKTTTGQATTGIVNASNVSVDAGQLTANSIYTDALDIGTGATVIIAPVAGGGPLAAQNDLQLVLPSASFAPAIDTAVVQPALPTIARANLQTADTSYSRSTTDTLFPRSGVGTQFPGAPHPEVLPGYMVPFSVNPEHILNVRNERHTAWADDNMVAVNSTPRANTIMPQHQALNEKLLREAVFSRLALRHSLAVENSTGELTSVDIETLMNGRLAEKPGKSLGNIIDWIFGSRQTKEPVLHVDLFLITF